MPLHVFHSHVDEASMARRRQFQEAHEGFFYYAPRTYHLVLLITLCFLLVLVLIPATFLFKQAVFLLVPLLWPNVALVGLLWGQVVARSQVDEEVDGWYYVKSHHAFDVPVGIVAAVSAAFVLVAGGLTISGYVGCTAQDFGDPASFLVFLFNTNDITAITTTTDVWRRPNFATELSWYQLCLDDKYAPLSACLTAPHRPYAIAFLAVLSVFLVFDLMVLAYAATLRETTIKIHQRLAASQPEQRIVYHLSPVVNPVFGRRLGRPARL